MKIPKSSIIHSLALSAALLVPVLVSGQAPNLPKDPPKVPKEVPKVPVVPKSVQHVNVPAATKVIAGPKVIAAPKDTPKVPAQVIVVPKDAPKAPVVVKIPDAPKAPAQTTTIKSPVAPKIVPVVNAPASVVKTAEIPNVPKVPDLKKPTFLDSGTAANTASGGQVIRKARPKFINIARLTSLVEAAESDKSDEGTAQKKKPGEPKAPPKKPADSQNTGDNGTTSSDDKGSKDDHRKVIGAEDSLTSAEMTSAEMTAAGIRLAQEEASEKDPTIPNPYIDSKTGALNINLVRKDLNLFPAIDKAILGELADRYPAAASGDPKNRPTLDQVHGRIMNSLTADITAESSAITVKDKTATEKLRKLREGILTGKIDGDIAINAAVEDAYETIVDTLIGTVQPVSISGLVEQADKRLRQGDIQGFHDLMDQAIDAQRNHGKNTAKFRLDFYVDVANGKRPAKDKSRVGGGPSPDAPPVLGPPRDPGPSVPGSDNGIGKGPKPQGGSTTPPSSGAGPGTGSQGTSRGSGAAIALFDFGGEDTSDPGSKEDGFDHRGAPPLPGPAGANQNPPDRGNKGNSKSDPNSGSNQNGQSNRSVGGDGGKDDESSDGKGGKKDGDKKDPPDDPPADTPATSATPDEETPAPDKTSSTLRPDGPESGRSGRMSDATGGRLGGGEQKELMRLLAIKRNGGGADGPSSDSDKNGPSGVLLTAEEFNSLNRNLNAATTGGVTDPAHPGSDDKSGFDPNGVSKALLRLNAVIDPPREGNGGSGASSGLAFGKKGFTAGNAPSAPPKGGQNREDENGDDNTPLVNGVSGPAAPISGFGGASRGLSNRAAIQKVEAKIQGETAR